VERQVAYSDVFSRVVASVCEAKGSAKLGYAHRITGNWTVPDADFPLRLDLELPGGRKRSFVERQGGGLDELGRRAYAWVREPAK
jgi:hypothetical protein